MRPDTGSKSVMQRGKKTSLNMLGQTWSKTHLALEDVWRQPDTSKQYLRIMRRERESSRVIFLAKMVLVLVGSCDVLLSMVAARWKRLLDPKSDSAALK